MCDDAIEDILPMGDLAARWRSFGWDVIEVDGHDIDALTAALCACRTNDGIPKVLLLHTVKGKGVSFMENVPAWHGAVLTDELYARAVAEVERGNRYDS